MKTEIKLYKYCCDECSKCVRSEEYPVGFLKRVYVIRTVTLPQSEGDAYCRVFEVVHGPVAKDLCVDCRKTLKTYTKEELKEQGLNKHKSTYISERDAWSRERKGKS